VLEADQETEVTHTGKWEYKKKKRKKEQRTECSRPASHPTSTPIENFVTLHFRHVILDYIAGVLYIPDRT